jgi:hypothetical protein
LFGTGQNARIEVERRQPVGAAPAEELDVPVDGVGDARRGHGRSSAGQTERIVADAVPGAP